MYVARISKQPPRHAIERKYMGTLDVRTHQDVQFIHSNFFSRRNRRSVCTGHTIVDVAIFSKRIIFYGKFLFHIKYFNFYYLLLRNVSERQPHTHTLSLIPFSVLPCFTFAFLYFCDTFSIRTLCYSFLAHMEWCPCARAPVFYTEIDKNNKNWYG